MRKKILRRAALLLLAALVIAALVIPYTRQWAFGPKHAGVPLCVWQDRLRREINPDRKDDYVAKLIRWFQPKDAKLPTDKLTRQDKIDIWLTLLDDPLPSVRTQAVQSLWGGPQHFLWSRGGSYRSLSSTLVDLDLRSFVIDSSASSTIMFSGEFLVRDSLLEGGIQPTHEVAPHLVRMIDDPDADVRAAVFQALSSQKKKAEPAFPRLFELLDHDDALRRRQAATTLNDTHRRTRAWLDRLTALLDDRDADVRRQVAVCLQGWHDRRLAVAAGPALLKSMCDSSPSVRIQAATSLAALGMHRTQAAATIRACLRHPEPGVRLHAIGYLFEPEPGDPHTLITELTQLVRADPDKQVRRAAIGALRLAGKQAVPLLIALLQHPEKEMRQHAMATLSNLGAEARAAVPFLIAGIDDDLGAERIRALAAIGDDQAIPKLVELLDDSAWLQNALGALPSFGPRAGPAASRLVKMLQLGSTDNCQLAGRTLIAMNLPRDQFVALLEPLLRDGTSQAYQHAVFLLAEAAPDHEAVLPALKRLAFEIKNAGRSEAFRWLREQGPRARNLVPLALKGLDDADDSIRAQCVQLLGAIGAEAAPAVPALMRLAEPPDANVGAHAITALGAIGADEGAVVPLLLRLLRKEETRDAALGALADLGPRARAAVPALLPLLKHERNSTRIVAAQTLLQVIARPEDALPHLAPMLRDEDDDVRWRVVKMLGDLGPAAHSAIPVLSALLDDDCHHLYEAALDALAAIAP